MTISYPPALDPRHRWAGPVRAMPRVAAVVPIAPVAAPMPQPQERAPVIAPVRAAPVESSPSPAHSKHTRKHTRKVPSLPPGLSIADTVLLAAASIRLRGAAGFIDGDLVVRAWKLAPHLFTLRGHSEHPDSQKVFARVYGPRGLVGRGLLDLVDVRTYRVTTKGRNTVRRIRAERGTT